MAIKIIPNTFVLYKCCALFASRSCPPVSVTATLTMKLLLLALLPLCLCHHVDQQDSRAMAAGSRAGLMSSRHRRNVYRQYGPPQLVRGQQRVYYNRPVLRPLPPRPYPVRPGMRIPYLPFFRVMDAPTNQTPPLQDGKQEDTTEAPAPVEVSPDAEESSSKKLLVKTALDNKSEAEVEVLPVTLVVDMDVLATGVLDLLNTLEETGMLPDDEEAQQFKAALQGAKEGEHQVFEVDPRSMNVIFGELMKSQMKQE